MHLSVEKWVNEKRHSVRNASLGRKIKKNKKFNMKYLPEILGYLSWVAAIVVSYYATIFAVKLFEKNGYGRNSGNENNHV